MSIKPRRLPVLRAACAAALMMLTRASVAASIPSYVADAVSAADRPDADKARDVARKPDQVIAFAGIEPGDKVADFMPGDGYFSRILCALVGASGHVYAVSIEQKGADHDPPLAPTCTNVTSIALRATKRVAPELWSSSDDPGVVYEYWSFTAAAETFSAPEPLDAIVLSGHYHGLHTAELGSPNVQLVDRALWNALKPGGVLLVEDAVGSRNAPSLHRIDAEQVKRELIAAGFELVGASQILRRDDDRHVANAHDLGAAADRFLLKFRKP